MAVWGSSRLFVRNERYEIQFGFLPRYLSHLDITIINLIDPDGKAVSPREAKLRTIYVGSRI